MSQNWESAPKTVTAVSIKIVLSVCREGVPAGAVTVYSDQVPRTDENGRQLKALLDYLLDGEIDAKDLFDALGVSSSTYYRRIKEADYPNAEELRLVADRFDLSYPDLQIQFGLDDPAGSLQLRRVQWLSPARGDPGRHHHARDPPSTGRGCPS